MKIKGGEFKGRTIEMAKGLSIRPTSDKVREALFDIIKTRLKEASILDLFAGTGSLGLEALSRGAGKVVFVDIQKRCTDSIKRTLRRLSVERERIDIYKYDALKALKKLDGSGAKFDMVFLDPPYYGGWIKKCLIALDKYDILYNSYLIICEHFKKDIVPQEARRFKIVRKASYGDTILSFYAR